MELSGESPEEQRHRLISDFARHHEVGTDIDADVDAIKDKCVYVTLSEELDGLVPIKELAWSFTAHPSDEVTVGETLRLRITEFASDPPRIILSRKARLPHPYDLYKRVYRIGHVVTGCVHHSTASHVFLDLAGGVDGVVYVGDLAHQRIGKASDAVETHQELRAEIKGFDDDRNQVELSVKALLKKPYDSYKELHDHGDVVRGRVRDMNRSFVYVDLPDGVQGAIHVKDLADRFVTRSKRSGFQRPDREGAHSWFWRRARASAPEAPERAGRCDTNRTRGS